MKKVIKILILDDKAKETLKELAKKGMIEKVEIEDKEYLEKVKKHIDEKLNKIKESLEALKEAGISEDIMVTYISDKTNMGKTAVRKILNAQKDFFNKLIGW